MLRMVGEAIEASAGPRKARAGSASSAASVAPADQAGDVVRPLADLRHHRRAPGHQPGAVAERGMRLGQRAWNDHRLQHRHPPVEGDLEAAP